MEQKEERKITQGDLRASLFEAFLMSIIPDEKERTEFMRKHKEDAIVKAKELLDQRFRRG